MSGRSGATRLRRADRLRRAQDFRRLGRLGQRRSGRHLVALVGPGFVPGRTRLGLTVSRRVGGAVQRNRVKRVIRAWFREHRCEVPAGKDVVIIARRGAADRSGAELRRELGDLLS